MTSDIRQYGANPGLVDWMQTNKQTNKQTKLYFCEAISRVTVSDDFYLWHTLPGRSFNTLFIINCQ
jgi:hypothetical protein